MIPSSTGFLAKDFEISVQPTYTYKMHLKSGTVQGYTDGQDAMRQAIYKILSTERYQYAMYSWNYGVELLDLRRADDLCLSGIGAAHHGGTHMG